MTDLVRPILARDTMFILRQEKGVRGVRPSSLSGTATRPAISAPFRPGHTKRPGETIGMGDDDDGRARLGFI